MGRIQSDQNGRRSGCHCRKNATKVHNVAVIKGNGHLHRMSNPTSGARNQSARRGHLRRGSYLRRLPLRTVQRESYNKFFGVRHVVALDISSGVQTFRAVVEGSVIGDAAGERLAEMVDWGVVGDEARGLDERLRGDERDKLALTDAVSDDVMDLLLLLRTVECPRSCRFVLAAGACAVGKKDLPDSIEFHKGDGGKNSTIQKNRGGDGVG